MFRWNRPKFFCLRLLFILYATALVLAGCSGSRNQVPTPPPAITLTYVQVTPANVTTTVRSTQQFAAKGTFSDGSTADITSSVAWTSSDTTLVTISNSGLAMATAIGRPQVTATSGGISGSTRMIIVQAATRTVTRFAYAAGNVDGTISEFTVTPATGQLRHTGYTFAGKGPMALIVEPNNKFIYVANSADNTISAFSIGQANGQLTAVAGSPFPSGSAPLALVAEPRGKFAYAVNSGSGNVSAYAINQVAGSLNVVAGSPFVAGANPSSIAVDPSGDFIYVTNPTSDNVSAYKIDPSSGGLSSVMGSPFTAGKSPSAVAVDPSGHFAYVANAVSTDVSAFAIDSASGALTAISASPFLTGAGMEIAGLTIDLTGKVLYVANFGSGSVSAFTIGSDGGLTAVSGSPFAVGSSPRSVQIDPSGKFAYVPTLSADEVEVFSINTMGALSLAGKVRTRPQAAAIAFSAGTAAVTYTPTFAYVANILSDNVSAFTINSDSGTLTPAAGSPFAAGSRPFGVTIDPGGKFVYVTNGNSNNVSVYTEEVNTGALNPVPGSPFPAGVGFQLGTPAVDPSGRFLYVPNYSSFQVFAYSVDPASGTLTQISGSPYAAAREPFSATVDPTGRFVYVACQNGPIYGGLSAYSIDVVSGSLTEIAGSPYPAGPEPSGVVVDPSGRFVYVSNQSTDTTFEFAIDAVTGGLTQIGATTPIMGAAVSITVEPSGRFAYATDGLAYTIDPTTGALSQITGASFAPGPIAFSITADPSGKFIYIADQGGGVSAYTIDPGTGILTPVVGAPFSAGASPISVWTTARIQ